MSAILRVAGWAALIIGLVWSVVNFIFVGWIALLFWLIVTFFLTVLLFGLVEVLERLEDQELKLLALRDSLEKLMKQDGLLAEGPQQCRRCGTQLPPGGKTCPTCHYVNEEQVPLRPVFLRAGGAFAKFF